MYQMFDINTELALVVISSEKTDTRDGSLLGYDIGVVTCGENSRSRDWVELLC